MGDLVQLRTPRAAAPASSEASVTPGARLAYVET
jgi:hypothetical protein